MVPKNGTAPLRIGTQDTESFFTGWLAEVAIFSKKLSATEIDGLYRRALGHLFFGELETTREPLQTLPEVFEPDGVEQVNNLSPDDEFVLWLGEF